jgi:hypothetical protein
VRHERVVSHRALTMSDVDRVSLVSVADPEQLDRHLLTPVS